jgi:cytosine/adenosine deaminase-related metal-dependent hydrolase
VATTVIRNADWVIAWDEGAGRHSYRRSIDIAFAENMIIFVGRNYSGAADRVIDGKDRLVLSGLIDIHSHPEHEPLYRGVREEHGLRNMYMTGLYERSQAFTAPDDEARAASAEFAYCELLLSGVTSLVDISPAWDGWIDLFARSGMRGFLAPGYASARWRLANDFDLQFAWDEERGREGFQTALALIDQAQRHPSGRLSGVVSPMQIENCTAELLRDSRDAAREHGIPFTVHIAQSVLEVQEMIRRHGKTPVQWTHDIDILGRDTILGHALFLDSHSWVRWWTKTDLALIADTGSSVAHCPTPFARYGQSWRISAIICAPASIWGSAPTRRRTIWSRKCARRRSSPGLQRAMSRR